MSKGAGDIENCLISHPHAFICDLCNSLLLYVLRDSFVWGAVDWSKEVLGKVQCLVLLWFTIPLGGPCAGEYTLRTALPLYWQVHGLAWELLQLQPSISPLSFGTPKGNEKALAERLWARQEFALSW